MQTGSLFKRLVLSAALGAVASNLIAQPPTAPYDPGAQFAPGSAAPGPQGAVQALFLNPVAGRRPQGHQTPYVDAHGAPVVVPASYHQSCEAGGYPMGGAAGPCMDPSGGYDYMDDVAMGNYGVDQHGPHYFDIRAEAVYMTRNEAFAQDIAFTSFNIGDDFVLTSGQLEYDYEPGFRILGRYDICPLSVIEFGYMGIYDWESTASFTDPLPVDADTGNLFSLFSNFGMTPPEVALEGGPMPETERSITHSIRLDSDLQTAEMTYRRYWVGFIPRVSGTLLAGFRYTRLKEDFLFSTRGEAGLDYAMRADNHLAGFQTGGDIWITVLQGLRVGAEGKVGIYNNHYSLDTNVTALPPVMGPPTITELFENNQAAFISEASVDVVADILPSWSLRAGYEVLFMNSIILTGENFNTGSPFGEAGQEPRVPFLADQGDTLYHGFHAGVEYIW